MRGGINPSYTPAQLNLAKALADRGQFDEAIAHYQTVVAFNRTPRPTITWAGPGGSGSAGRSGGPLPEGAEDQSQRRGTAEESRLACATSPEARLRNGAEAVELARRANQLSDGKRADVLDTLAAAYAAAERFPEALATVRKPWSWPRKRTISP